MRLILSIMRVMMEWMNQLASVSLVVLIFLLPHLVLAQEIEAEVARQIAMLNSAKREDRAAAQRALVILGETALPHIEEQSGDDPGLTLLLEKIAREIRENSAAKSLQERLISFEVKSLSLPEFAQRLSTRSGNLISISPDVKSLQLMIDPSPKSFWNWIDDVTVQYGLKWRVSQSGVLLEPGESTSNAQVAYANFTRVEASMSENRQQLSTKDRRLFRVNVRVDVEPRVTPYFLTVEDDQFSLTNEKTVVDVFNPDASRELHFQGNQTVTFSADFVAGPDQDFSQPMNFAGEFNLFCAARNRRVELPLRVGANDVAKRMIVRSVRRTEHSTEIVAIILLPTQAEEFESHRIGALHRHVWLTDETEEVVRPNSIEILRAAETDHLVRFRFPTNDNSDSIRLIYFMPEMLTHAPISFTVKNLDFP